MTIAQLQIELQNLNWKFGKPFLNKTGVSWYAYKAFPGFDNCTSNEKPPVVVINPWLLRDEKSIEMEVCGEINKKNWVQILLYGLNRTDVIEKLDYYVSKLRAMWNTATKCPEGECDDA